MISALEIIILLIFMLLLFIIIGLNLECVVERTRLGRLISGQWVIKRSDDRASCVPWRNRMVEVQMGLEGGLGQH